MEDGFVEQMVIFIVGKWFDCNLEDPNAVGWAAIAWWTAEYGC